MKTAKINGVYVKTYVDTGRQVNILKIEVAKLLGLDMKPSFIMLKGFNGSSVMSKGEVQFNLQLDGLDMVCTAHLTDVEMDGVNLLIGQPIINDEGVSLTVRNGTALLQMDEPDILTRMDVTEENERFKVTVASKERIPPGTSIIKVHIRGNRSGNDVVTPTRHFDLHGVTYSLPATLLCGSEGYLKVVNTGSKDVDWSEGTVLLRAESCEEASISQVSPNATTLPSLLSKSVLSTSLAKPKSPQEIGGIAITDLDIGPVNEAERKALLELLSEYDDCFACDTNDLGCTNLVQMQIRLKSDQPINYRPYRLSHNELETVKSKITDLLGAGIIKESESCYASPVILVRKKNGDRRLCVDYRALIAITIRERFPLPNIDDQLSQLAGKNYFTSLDMAQSYHQVPISPEDTHKTAFVTPHGHYEYTRVPFGLANAPSVFMRLINKVVESIGSTEILAFLDDLLLPSVDVQTGIELLKNVLAKLQTENLKLNMRKCSFLQKEITYLGHKISPNSIQPGELKLAAVSQFPTPRNVHEIRQFIGLYAVTSANLFIISLL